MAKIKFQGGLTKRIASAIAKRNKARFAKYIERNAPNLNKNRKSKSIEIGVVSFSSGKDFADQVLSILSFLRYIGVPSSWTVYSDGSHTEAQIKLIQSLFEFVDFVHVDWQDSANLPILKKSLQNYKAELFDYAMKKPLGKKAFFYLNHPIKSPTLFLDADIVFYNKATMFDFLLKEKTAGWYMTDPQWGCLDSRYIKNNQEQLYQVNGGCILFNHEAADLSSGLEFLKSLHFEYEYFTDQTIFHIICKGNDFMPLDPRIFILNSGDQFDFSYLYPKENMALRHYTGPVRHKMWQRDWKWQLSLS